MKARVKTGGKLYLAGEYAILRPGQTAILKNIPIYMTADIAAAADYHIFSDLFDFAVGLEPEPHYQLIQESIEVMNAYLDLQQIKTAPFSLSIKGKMEKDGKKLGIGSSGSVVVLTLKAMAAFYGLSLSCDLLFKLSSYVLLRRGDNGSMGDLACIAYDDLIAYTSFDRREIKRLIYDLPMAAVLSSDWGYQISPIQLNLKLEFLVGWTKQPSISKEMINLVKSSITEDFLQQTQVQVLLLQRAFEIGDKAGIKDSLERVSFLLEQLHPAIYNDKLRLLKAACHGLDIVAKSSGSGGGDCGIALSFNSADSDELLRRWEQADIVLLDRESL